VPSDPEKRKKEREREGERERERERKMVNKRFKWLFLQVASQRALE
jgi:hypothetical protein